MKLGRLRQMVFGRDFVKRTLLGLAIGIASITPGLSGGVIAATTGVYERAIIAIVNVREEFRRSVVFLAPLALGAGIGMLLFSRVMQELMARAEFTVLYVFLGLVAGGVPSLVKEANRDGFRLTHLAAVPLALAAVVWVSQISAWAPGQSGETAFSPGNIVLYGAVVAIGTIIPGVSSSFILIHLGAYQDLLAALTSLDLRILFLLGCGFVVTGLVIVRFVECMFRRFRGLAYYSVLGFLMGSMAMVFPGFRSGWGLALDIFLFVGGAAASYAVTRFGSKQES